MMTDNVNKLEYLLKQLNHVITSMRYSAARALGEYGDPAAIEPLLQTLKNDPVPAVRDAARIALLELGVDPTFAD
ncbi:MAG: hypothetical protein CUN55_08025 [Phototrophicales bacterium]|nr:MAG: hypothetical protein CUN55_08025 [Phototrophicales bacterium]